MDELRAESAPESGARKAEVDGTPAGILQRLISIARSLRALLGLRLAEIGLGNGQDEVLLGLEPRQVVSTVILAARLDLRDVSLTRLLDPLLAKGLVEHVGEIGNSRRIMVRLTPAGVDMQEKVRALWNEVGSDLIDTDGTEQLDRLTGELEGLRREMDSRLTHFR